MSTSRPDPFDGLEVHAFRRWNADRRGALATRAWAGTVTSALVAAPLSVIVAGFVGAAHTFLPGDVGVWLKLVFTVFALFGALGVLALAFTTVLLPWLWLRNRRITIAVLPHHLHFGSETVPLHDCLRVDTVPLTVHRRDGPALVLPEGYELTPATETALLLALQEGIARSAGTEERGEARQQMQKLRQGVKC